MSASTIYDFEGVVESAAVAVFEGLGINAFTTQDTPDFQKARPRVEIKFTLGAGLNRFVSIKDGQVVTPATPDVTPSLVFFLRRESAWMFELEFDVLTAADIKAHAAYRAKVRAALGQFWVLMNDSPGMENHCIQMDSNSGNSPVLVAPEQGIMKTEIRFNGKISVQMDAWPKLAEEGD